MKNNVYWPSGRGPLSNQELIRAARDLARKTGGELSPAIENDPWFFRDRIVGDMCDCKGTGEFVLWPTADCVEGGKRYMTCRKCGKTSHL